MSYRSEGSVLSLLMHEELLKPVQICATVEETLMLRHFKGVGVQGFMADNPQPHLSLSLTQGPR